MEDRLAKVIGLINEYKINHMSGIDAGFLLHYP